MLDADKPRVTGLLDSEVEVFTKRGSGPGGQHRNKTDSCVVMRHRPTGIEVKVDGRDQQANRRAARARLEARLLELRSGAQVAEVASLRKGQVGSGMRGDKVRTYRERDDVVIDHVTEQKLNFKRVTSGHLDG